MIKSENDPISYNYRLPLANIYDLCFSRTRNTYPTVAYFIVVAMLSVGCFRGKTPVCFVPYVTRESVRVESVKIYLGTPGDCVQAISIMRFYIVPIYNFVEKCVYVLVYIHTTTTTTTTIFICRLLFFINSNRYYSCGRIGLYTIFYIVYRACRVAYSACFHRSTVHSRDRPNRSPFGSKISIEYFHIIYTDDNNIPNVRKYIYIYNICDYRLSKKTSENTCIADRGCIGYRIVSSVLICIDYNTIYTI